MISSFSDTKRERYPRYDPIKGLSTYIDAYMFAKLLEIHARFVKNLLNSRNTDVLICKKVIQFD